MIVLTSDYMKSAAARAVPGAEFEGGAWVLPNPTPRAAVVALKLFPHLMHEHPELVEPMEWLAEAVLALATCDARTCTGRVLYSGPFLDWSRYPQHEQGSLS